MNQLDKIDFMIKSLELVKDEVLYAKTYNGHKRSQGKDFWTNYGNDHRSPCKATVEDTLKTVGRISFQLSHDIDLEVDY